MMRSMFLPDRGLVWSLGDGRPIIRRDGVASSSLWRLARLAPLFMKGSALKSPIR